MRFRSSRSGHVTADLQPVEVAVLASAAADLADLLSEPEDDAPRDPLEELVGLSPAARRPDDPAVQRLLPDAYRDDAFGSGADPEQARAAAAEFRRFTDAELRAAKRRHADTVLETLAEIDGGRLQLSRDAADDWLGFLTDVRLVLGVRLGVDEHTLDDELPDDGDPRTEALRVYSWLGWLQESLLSCLEPRPS